MTDHLYHNTSLLKHFTFDAIHRPFTELQTAAGKFGDMLSMMIFIRYENLISIIDQQTIYADVELLGRHLVVCPESRVVSPGS